MNDQPEKKSRKTQVPQSQSRKEESNLMDSADELTTTYTGKSDEQAEFPEEWVAIAAYYIWKNEGETDRGDTEYWDRAKAELRQLQRNGALPANPLNKDGER